MVTREQHVILPSTPLFLVDRSWRSTSKASDIHFDWQNSAEKSRSITLRNTARITAIESPHGAGTPQRVGAVGRQTKSLQDQICETGRKFEFINATNPEHARDPEVQRLVKSHVKKGVPRHRTKATRKMLKSKSISSSSSNETQELVEAKDKEAIASLPLNLGSICSGSASPFYGNKANAVLSGSRSQCLLSYYLDVVALSWYPLEHHLAYSPVKAGWLPLAMTDEFLFRSVLFSSASRLAVEDGHPEIDEPKLLVEPIFGQLNQRLKHSSELSDSTIAIVACLAMVEISLGNYNKWKVHMMAMKEIVRLRGGIHSIEMLLQTKICRADIEGATDCLSSPCLSPLPRYAYITSSSFPLRSRNKPIRPSVTLLKTLHICPRLYPMLHTLSQLSHAMDHALRHPATTSLNPRTLDEEFSLLLHQLLSWRPSHSSSLDEALQLGALLYAKSITRLATAHVRPVVRRLISALGNVVEEQQGMLPLRVWFLLVGAVAVRTGSKERAWFVAGIENLREMASDGKPTTWDEVKLMLEEMPWIPTIHEAPWIEVWEEAEAMRHYDLSYSSKDPAQ